MKYLLRLTDAGSEHMVLLTLSGEEVGKSAVDVIFDTVGSEDLTMLVRDGILGEGQLEDLRAFQSAIFDRDAQGLFIRDGVEFFANGKPLDPDGTLARVFVPAELEGMSYQRCDLVIKGAHPILASASSSTIGVGSPSASQEAQVEGFARLMFLHQLALGSPIDVTKDYPEIADVIAWAEKQNLIEIDVQKASYKLTAQGNQAHDAVMKEAQELIKKYDIYGDVDVDHNGSVHFDSGLGKDLRVPVFEVEGVDPFRARFLIGLSDGEWDKLSNWLELCHEKSWYAGIFEPVERAPGQAEIGREMLLRIIDEGKAAVRQEWQSR